MFLHESNVEDAALELFEELCYVVGHGSHAVSGEPGVVLDWLGEMVIAGSPHITQSPIFRNGQLRVNMAAVVA
jgi:hypothetical protein